LEGCTRLACSLYTAGLLVVNDGQYLTTTKTEGGGILVGRVCGAPTTHPSAWQGKPLRGMPRREVEVGNTYDLEGDGCFGDIN
jgi:hypothetical protein